MPAQASEVSGDYRPGYLSGSGSGDVIGPKVTDNKVTSERSVVPQLEAAVIAYKVTNSFSDEKSLDVVAGCQGYGAAYEVGWRGYTTAT